MAQLMVNMLSCFAAFEREIIRERTLAGIDRAQRQGKHIGRPRLVVDRQRVADLKAAGKTRDEIAREVGCGVRSVSRLWK